MYTYDPSKVVVSFKGIILLGPYAEGTFISAKRDAPLFTRKAGADGEVARARVKNKMGTVEFTLSQAAPANVILSQYALVGENAGLDVRTGFLAEDPAPAVLAPKAADVSSADKAARNLPGVTGTATLAGAINSTQVAITLTT